jgi:fatty-acyl-CoA synthase
VITRARTFASAQHPWVGRRVPDMLAEAAERWPDHIAVLDGDDEISYAELLSSARDVARNLAAAGVVEGDHVATFLGESWKHTAIIYGVLQVGAVIVPLNMTWERAEIDRALEDADVSHLIAQGQHRGLDVSARLEGVADNARLRRVWWMAGSVPSSFEGRAVPAEELLRPASGPVPESTNQAGYLMFTSGSSAAPKAALIEHQAALGVGYYAGKRLELEPGHRFLNISPFYHTGGLILGMTNPHQFGAGVRVSEGYDHDRMVANMLADASDVLIGFDVVTMRLVHAGQEHGRIPFSKIITGPGFSVYDELTALGIDHIIIYGMTELSNFTAISSKADPHEVRRESNGYPLPGVEIKIVDIHSGRPVPVRESGEIRVRGWNTMLGYYQGNGAVELPSDHEGFFPTGDYGFVDEAGRIYYRGRFSAMIKTGGENVSQAEVENFLMRDIPGVRQAAVIGVPDQKWGEAVVAFVELDDDAVTRDPAELRELCRGKIAGYKIPKKIHVVSKDGWPVTPTGKIVKPALADIATDGGADQASVNA